jgi:tRNA (cytidine/uridine-2'-O-)-methyltransferase
VIQHDALKIGKAPQLALTGAVMRLALFQPDIPPNTGTMIRLGACLGVAIDIIEPCGFPFSDKSLKRAGMDYLDRADITRHLDFAAFNSWRQSAGHRLIAVETESAQRHDRFAFRADDILMLGQETSGTPQWVLAACDAVISIPMRPGIRSLNVAIAAAIALGEALRQTESYPA